VVGDPPGMASGIEAEHILIPNVGRGIESLSNPHLPQPVQEVEIRTAAVELCLATFVAYLGN